jgi:lysyl-tRNA synthetase class 2
MAGRIQLYIDKTHAQAEEIKSWDIGDIVGATGPVHKSGKGDLYVLIESAQLLTKSLRPLPDKWHGLSDTETRYRQRYVDLIVNEDVKRVFRIRSIVIDGRYSSRTEISPRPRHPARDYWPNDQAS